MAGLRPSQLRKAAHTCKYVAYKKLDRLLVEMDKPRLGFEAGIIPDGTWLYKVARFVDPANVCSIFEVALVDMPTAGAVSFSVELGKRAAEDYLIRSSGLNEVAKVRSAVGELTLLQKKLASKQAKLDHLYEKGRQLEKEVEQSKRELHSRLVSATVTVYGAGHKLKPEEATEGSDKELQAIHELYSEK